MIEMIALTNICTPIAHTNNPMHRSVTDMITCIVSLESLWYIEYDPLNTPKVHIATTSIAIPVLPNDSNPGSTEINALIDAGPSSIGNVIGISHNGGSDCIFHT